MNKQEKIDKFATWVLLIVLLWGFSACSEEKPFRVLVIHSYEKSFPAYVDFDKMISREFKKQGLQTDIRTFYLNCELYLDGPELNRMDRMLDSMASWRPDIILVNEDQATFSLLKCGNPLVKKTPVVFAGVNYPNGELIKQYPNVTGLHDKIDIKANIRMMQQLYGNQMEFVAILDSTYMDRKIRADMKEQLEGSNVVAFPQNLNNSEFSVLRSSGHTFLSALAVRGIERERLIWNLNSSYSRCLIQLKRDFTNVNIGNMTKMPIFTAINEAFNYGERLLGGYMTTLPIQVEEEVAVAARILRGEVPRNIPVCDSRKISVVDWNVMQSLGISKERVPTDCEIINIPFKEQYREWWTLFILLASVIIITLFGFVVFLYRREEKRKRLALLELADEKESLALAIEGSDTFVWKIKGDQICIERAFWEAIGSPARELTMTDFIALIRFDQRCLLEQYWERRFQPGKKIIQFQLRLNDKGYQWWEFRYSTTLSGTEKIRMTGLLLNIQGFKEREQELEEARLLAEKAELKQSFLANMSHEIRTPLNSIVGFSNILASDIELEEEEKQEYIETINRNSDLLLKLVNDILELSRIESGYMSFVFERCNVSEVMGELYATHQLLVPSRLEFIKENHTMQAVVNADKSRLTQVITNFLNNAVKFTQSGYIRLGYEVAVTQKEVRIYVEDSGKGIAKEEQRMIFSRFYKQDEFAQGTGLGLSICQTIAEKLGGRIELWSELGKGSRFTIVLPVISIS